MDLLQCELRRFEPMHLRPEEIEAFDLTFDLWKSVWKETFEKMSGPEYLPSDNFTRQSEVLALFFEGKPIALVCHRIVDLKSRSSIEDSYFRVWPEDSKRELLQLGKNCVLGSQISIAPQYRKLFSNLPTKQIISYLSLYHLKDQGFDVVVGMMRADKGMEEVFYQSGARCLAKKQMYYDIPVDLVVFLPKLKPIVIPEEFQFAVSRIYTKYLKNNPWRKNDRSVS